MKFDSPKQYTNVDFACPTCLEELLEATYERKLKELQQECAVLRQTNPLEAIRHGEIRFRELIKRKQADREFFLQGHRPCEAVREAPEQGGATQEPKTTGNPFADPDELPDTPMEVDEAPRRVSLYDQMLRGSIVRANELATQKEGFGRKESKSKG